MGFPFGKKADFQLNNTFQKLLRNHWIKLVARLLLGSIFIYASYHKILAPDEFAKIVYGYDLFPSETINLIAIIIPFVELISGMALIIGIYTRPAAIILIGMLTAFVIAISINIIRGHEFDCGCFSSDTSQAVNSAWQTLGRDMIFMMLGIYIFAYGQEKLINVEGK
jgi:putative oxidoreductase